MKKIIMAFDGSHFSNGAFSFARELNKLQPIMLTAVFAPQLDLVDMWSYGTSLTGQAFVPDWVNDSDLERVQTNMNQFRSLCHQYGIEYRVHDAYYGPALPELKKESRFADLLLVGSEGFYSQEGEVSEYLKAMLQLSECPVLVVPENYNFPQSNILAYDGSASSVYALRQFSYLFPELCAHPSLLVYMDEENEVIPEKEKVQELVAQHYPDCQFLKLGKERKNYFRIWISEKERGILVSGAFGRSALSQLFRRSFVMDIIQEQQMPVFIAHK